MSFFDDNAHEQIAPLLDVSGFANALHQRQAFTLPDPSPRMVQALARQTQEQTLLRASLSVGPSALKPIALIPSASTLSSTSNFTPLEPKDLQSLICPSTLILDVRSHGHYARSRLIGAVNLAVPTTLLRRPAFSLDKLCAMLPDQKDKDAFGLWKMASTVVVYDADSTILNDGNNVLSLLNKLKAASAPGKLCYVLGGLAAVLASNIPGIVDASDPLASTKQESEGVGEAVAPSEFLSVRHLSISAFQQGSTTGAAQRLPALPSQMGAPGPMTTRTTFANPFFDNIRQHRELAQGITERIPLYIPKATRKRVNELPFSWLRDIVNWSGGSWALKVSEEGKEDVGSPSGSTWSGRSSARRRAREAMEEGTEALAMQFYRIELREQRRLQGVMDQHTRESTKACKGIPAYGPGPDVGLGSGDRAAASRKPESDSSSSEEYFPFSITAGIEKGSKNRYRNIWPFDHARVRLHRHCSDDDSDYINASYIQPRGTTKQYIATQGPLPSTFNDFWSLVWEQNVRVIVMLTKRVEGHHVKSGHYWQDGMYGPLKLALVKEEGGTAGERAEENNPEGQEAPVGGFDWAVSAKSKAKKARRAKADMDREFGKDFQPKSSVAKDRSKSSPRDDLASSSEDEDDDSIIRRQFVLTHTQPPGWPPRTIVQFQYVGWPDVSVPSSPKNILKLINEINVLREEYRDSGVIGVNEADAGALNTTSNSRTAAHTASRADAREVDAEAGIVHGRQANCPTLVHCSAGVGRTGAFIVMDAILDAVRKEVAKKLAASAKEDVRDDVVEMEDLAAYADDDDVGSTSANARELFESTDSLQHMEFEDSSSPAPNASQSNLPALSMMSLASSPPNSEAFGNRVKTDLYGASGATTDSLGGSIVQRRKSGVKEGRYMSSSTSFTHQTDSLASLLNPSAISTKPSSAGPPSPKDMTSFDFTVPRKIIVPKHSRKNHPGRTKHSRILEQKLEVLKEEKTEQSESENIPHDDGSSSDPSADQIRMHGGDPSLVKEDSASPPSSLNSLDEPVREVLEGIREQRMSMVQTLRQYIFIHRAIVDGALQIVDVEQGLLDKHKHGDEERVDGAQHQKHGVDTQAGSVSQSMNVKSTENVDNDVVMEVSPPSPGLAISPSKQALFGGGLLDLSRSASGGPTSTELLQQPSTSSSHKRLASPTELIRTDHTGPAGTVGKRPSLKRINKSFDSGLQ